MSARSLNKVILIGNLTRDPELRYTPSGTAVCTLGLATNRSWTTQTGETREETEFHRIVAWNKLGELCSQLLSKGRKTYVEGRLATHSWTAQDGSQRTTTEIVIDDMIILDSKKFAKETAEGVTVSEEAVQSEEPLSEAKTDEIKAKSKPKKKEVAKEESIEEDEEKKKVEETVGSQDLTPDDIPF